MRDTGPDPAPKPRPARPRRRRRRGLETEQKLLDAANEVFWTHGFAGSTVTQIVAASGLSVGSFYHQFSDKRELLDRAAQRLLTDFDRIIGAVELSRERNGDLYSLFHRVSLAGRLLVGRNRGIYRATGELAQNNLGLYGPIAKIGPTIARALNAAMPEYADQMVAPPTRAMVNHALQTINACTLSAELGMTPLFPADPDTVASVIARAACGVLGYTGQTERLLTKDP